MGTEMHRKYTRNCEGWENQKNPITEFWNEDLKLKGIRRKANSCEQLQTCQKISPF